MPGASLHLTHSELLAEETRLPATLRQAMSEEITYTRLGAVFPDLPFYTNIVAMMLNYWLEMPAENCPLGWQMHRYNPQLFAWHFLASTKREHILDEKKRLALLGGFFSHVALDLEIHPLVNWISRRDAQNNGGHESHHHRLVEKYQSLFFHRDFEGRDILGRSRFFLERAYVTEKPPFFRLNLDQPIVHWSTDMLRGYFLEAGPTSQQFAHHLRAFRHFTFMVSLPPLRKNSDKLGTPAARQHYYECEEFSFPQYWQYGYERSVQLLSLAYEFYANGDFSEERRDYFLEAAQISDLSYPPDKYGLPVLPENAQLEPALNLAG